MAAILPRQDCLSLRMLPLARLVETVMANSAVITVTPTVHAGTQGSRLDDTTVRSGLKLPEYQYLHALLGSSSNLSPRFLFPDLVSACVSLALGQPDGVVEVFRTLRGELVLRDPHQPRRQCDLWYRQFVLLRELQVSADNHYPHPQFQLDQFTTTCVVITSRLGQAEQQIVEQARRNTAQRVAKQVH